MRITQCILSILKENKINNSSLKKVQPLPDLSLGACTVTFKLVDESNQSVI
jgi:hypothetical protein